MRLKAIPISIDTNDSDPLFHRVAEGLIQSIQAGGYPAGTVLPGIEALSEQLKISRTTVISAYGELQARGWVKSRKGHGTYVAEQPPAGQEKAWIHSSMAGSRELMAFDMPTRQDLATSQLAKQAKLSDSHADPRLMPSEALGKAFQAAVRRHHEEFRDHDDPRGYRRLREVLSEHVALYRGLSVNPECILVTCGKRMALNLLAQSLLKSEDVVAVEEPGNPVAWESFNQVRAQLIGVPVDSKGIDLNALEDQLRRHRIRVLYLSPRYQVPTTAFLSEERRARLLELAQQHRFIIVEDDSEAEYAYESNPVPSLASQDKAGSVIHIFSFSRMMAPGIRLGVIVASPLLIERFALLSPRLEGQGDPVLESAMADLMSDGEIHRHLQRVRKVYMERRDVAAACLSELYEGILEFEVPDGGLSFWIRADQVDLEAWHRACQAQRIQFHLGERYTLDRRHLQAFRLGFGSFSSSEMAEILVRMQEALPR